MYAPAVVMKNHIFLAPGAVGYPHCLSSTRMASEQHLAISSDPNTTV